MAVPTPVVPTFTDGQIVHGTDLNALGTNLTNLYNYNQAGFQSQRPCVIAQQTTAQVIANATDTLITFQSAAVNTDNMWTASLPDRLTIQHAGIYTVFSQVRWPTFASPALTIVSASNILANGTSAFSNTIASNLLPMVNGGAGCGTQCSTLVNLAAGATIYLDVWQNTAASQTLKTDFGGTFLGAIFLTPST